MNVIEIFAKFVVDTSELDKAVKSASSLGDSLGNGLASMAKLGAEAIAACTAAVGAVGAASVKAGMDFDQSMSQVAATMGLTTEEMANQVGEVDLAWGHFSGTMRDFALEMGRNTAFSATQAADALNYMALAGYSVQESMDMLPNVLNLAAAGAMDLATASDMITDTQTAFGITAERTTQMVDEMAKAASTGNTSVSQLGNAFLVVGALAKELNGGMITLADGTQVTTDGVQELETAFTAMANAGIKGSEAGTHMRNMIMKLSGPTSDGVVALEKMGVKIFDTEGKMRSLGTIFQELSSAMSTMSQEAKITTIQDLFNARDLASAEALLGAVEGTVVKIGDDVYSMGTAYEKFGDAIYDSAQGFEIVQSSWDKIGESILDAEGAAQQMADTQLDNLAGDITLFKSALEGAEIAISDKLTPTLRDFVKFGMDGLTKLTNAFTDGGLDAAVEQFGKLLSDGLTKIVDKTPEMVRAGAKLLSALIKGFWDNREKLWDAFKNIIRAITTTLGDEFPQFKSFFDKIQKAADGLFGFIEKNGGTIISVLHGVLNGFLAYEAAISVFNGIQTAIKGVQTVMAVLNGEMALTSLVNPYTAIAAGIGVVIGVMTTLIDLEKQENEAYIASITTLTEEEQRRLDAANEYIGKLDEMYSRNRDVVQSVEDELKPEQELREELYKIVDANGRIKEGYEERAQAIVTQLNEAFGTEMELQDGVIANYDAEMQKIDQLIEKKKAEALLDANKDAYAQALKEQMDLYDSMMAVQTEYEETQRRRAVAVAEAEQAEISMNEAMLKGSPSAATYGKRLQELTETIYECDLYLQSHEESLRENQRAYYASQDFIDDYNELLKASTENTGNLSKAVEDMTNGIIENAPDEILEGQAQRTLDILADMLDKQAKGVRISESQIEAAVSSAEGAVEAMREAGLEGADAYGESLEELVNKANSWGTDFVSEFTSGIEKHKSSLSGAVENMANSVRSRLHFSEPDVGPLSDFSTYAPDMMDLFAQGVTQNTRKVTDAVENAFDFSDMIKSPQDDFSGAIGQNSGLITPTVGRDLTVVLQVNEEQLGKVVYRLNNDEVQRVGVDLGKAVMA